MTRGLPYIYTMLSNGRWVYRNTKTGRFASRNQVVAESLTVFDVGTEKRPSKQGVWR